MTGAGPEGPAPGSARGRTEDERRLAGYGQALADGIEAALPGWVERSVARVLAAWGRPVPPDAPVRAHQAGEAAVAAVVPPLRRLLAADVDDQRTNPLAVVRGAVRFPTQVLRDLGVPPVVRDADAEARFPDDLYDLTPGAFADLGPELHEAGLVWGAAKAHVHLARHRSAG